MVKNYIAIFAMPVAVSFIYDIYTIMPCDVLICEINNNNALGRKYRIFAFAGIKTILTMMGKLALAMAK